MRVLIESYNTVSQNIAGGIQMRIKKLREVLTDNDVEVRLFNKWEDKVSDFNILHIFKLNIEDLPLISHAKSNNVPVVVSSVVALEKKFTIYMNRILCKLLPIHTVHSYMEKVLELSDAIIVQTKKEGDFIRKVYRINENKIHIIPNGANVNMKDGDPKLIRDYINVDSEFILQVGRFDRNKNQLNVIRAMQETSIPIVFIGGPDPNELLYFEQCKKEATKNMHFLGWLKNDDPLLSSAYANSKVVVLPSHKEIFGNSLIEGGAAGANLVATKELPISEWGLGDYCFQINPTEINDIKNKLIKAYNTPKNPEVSQEIIKKFSWNEVAKMHIDLYKSL